MGERFKPAVLKTADGQPSVSSNLTVSASTYKKRALAARLSFLQSVPTHSFGPLRSPPKGCQLFRAAYRIAVNQPDPQARAFDDDVIHADSSALVEKLGARFVQDHCCYVVGFGDAVTADAVLPSVMLPTNARRCIAQVHKANGALGLWMPSRFGPPTPQKKARNVRAEHLRVASGRDVEGGSTTEW